MTQCTWSMQARAHEMKHCNPVHQPKLRRHEVSKLQQTHIWSKWIKQMHRSHFSYIEAQWWSRLKWTGSTRTRKTKTVHQSKLQDVEQQCTVTIWSIICKTTCRSNIMDYMHWPKSHNNEDSVVKWNQTTKSCHAQVRDEHRWKHDQIKLNMTVNSATRPPCKDQKYKMAKQVHH